MIPNLIKTVLTAWFQNRYKIPHSRTEQVASLSAKADGCPILCDCATVTKWHLFSDSYQGDQTTLISTRVRGGAETFSHARKRCVELHVHRCMWWMRIRWLCKLCHGLIPSLGYAIPYIGWRRIPQRHTHDLVTLPGVGWFGFGQE